MQICQAYIISKLKKETFSYPLNFLLFLIKSFSIYNNSEGKYINFLKKVFYFYFLKKVKNFKTQSL